MPVTDKPFLLEYVSPKGGKFHISSDKTGLLMISMANGGVSPSICETKYTSLNMAKKALERYFQSKTTKKASDK